MMIDASHEVIYTVLDKEDADRVCRALSGMRVYFPTSRTRQKEVRESYRTMGGLSRAERVKRLAQLYELSEQTIRRIIIKAQNDRKTED